SDAAVLAAIPARTDPDDEIHQRPDQAAPPSSIARGPNLARPTPATPANEFANPTGSLASAACSPAAALASSPSAATPRSSSVGCSSGAVANLWAGESLAHG